MRMLLYSVVLCILVQAPLHAQTSTGHAVDRKIVFPDVDGFLSLTLDLHMHSVFSDGSVWPDVRVQEAQRDGLDGIATTEHLEYQPHRDDIPHPDRNRSNALMTQAASNSDLIVIPGSEITRDMPPGHANAIFIKDANPLLLDDARTVYAEAHRQGAFTFWNHPNWTAQRKDGIARFDPIHLELIEAGHLNGIEIVNEHTVSYEAMQLAIDYGLTMIGTSDIHGLIDWLFDIPGGGHRPVTIAFAEKRSQDSIRDALFAGRTVVYFKDTLLGLSEHLVPLLEASITAERAAYGGESSVLNVHLKNRSSVNYILRNTSEYTFHGESDVVSLDSGSELSIGVKTLERRDRIILSFEVMNAVTAPGEHPSLVLLVEPEPAP